MTEDLNRIRAKRAESKELEESDFGCLSHRCKRTLSGLAGQALRTPYPDVILAIDKMVLVNRKPKKYINRQEPYGRRIQFLKQRVLRPEFAHTVKPVPIKTWEDLCADYKALCRRNTRMLKQAIEADEIIPIGHRLLKARDLYAKQDRMLYNLEKFRNRKPYKYTRLLCKKVANYKADRLKRERKVLKKLNTPNSPQKAARAAMWFAWRDRMRKQLPIMAEYFNFKIRIYRQAMQAKGLKPSKVRPLKPCQDLNHEIYYRTVRDKFIPFEVFNTTFNPFPSEYEIRIRFPQKIYFALPNTL